MAEDGGKPAEPTEFELDLDAVVPRPNGYLTLRGQRFAVLSVIDIGSRQMFQVMQEEREATKGPTLEEHVLMMRRHLGWLFRESDGEGGLRPVEAGRLQPLLDECSARQIIRAYLAAMRIAHPPLSADESPASLSSLPSSAVSTAGASQS